jgi:hypothetical protein
MYQSVTLFHQIDTVGFVFQGPSQGTGRGVMVTTGVMNASLGFIREAYTNIEKIEVQTPGIVVCTSQSTAKISHLKKSGTDLDYPIIIIIGARRLNLIHFKCSVNTRMWFQMMLSQP